MNALLTLPTLFVQVKIGSGMCAGTCCSSHAGRPEHLDRAPTQPVEVVEDVNNGAHLLLGPQRIPTLPVEFLGVKLLGRNGSRRHLHPWKEPQKTSALLEEALRLANKSFSHTI